MKLCISVLAMLLLLGSAVASDRQWQDATLVEIRVNQGQNGVAVVPIGTSLYGIPFERWTAFYIFDTATTRYVLNAGRHKPYNLTQRGKNKFAVEGQKAYIIDDAGKEIKLPISQKALLPGAEAK